MKHVMAISLFVVRPGLHCHSLLQFTSSVLWNKSVQAGSPQKHETSRPRLQGLKLLSPSCRVPIVPSHVLPLVFRHSFCLYHLGPTLIACHTHFPPSVLFSCPPNHSLTQSFKKKYILWTCFGPLSQSVKDWRRMPESLSHRPCVWFPSLTYFTKVPCIGVSPNQVCFWSNSTIRSYNWLSFHYIFVCFSFTFFFWLVQIAFELSIHSKIVSFIFILVLSKTLIVSSLNYHSTRLETFHRFFIFINQV